MFHHGESGTNAESERTDPALQYRRHPQQRRKHLGSSHATDADRRPCRENSVYSHGHRSGGCDRWVGLATRAQP
ncbi:hypothetical protein IEO21_10739 [Rhodonia placenta]|uniref:Uncharacterized protein n=1 Tax=Rhodonia placenta TaxID=104341 RepID=A0A8H7NS67_9APHY|nr:hypothetical protein IEO21_10739 [Postia placenta]